VAATYVAIRDDQAKIELVQQVIEVDEDLYELARSRFEAGLSTEQDVAAILGTLEVDRASLYALTISLKLNIYSLGVLLGKMPEAVLCNFLCPAPIPDSGGLVPAGIPADLLRRRPDILAAERNLAAASEQIGVAVSELYPTVSLIGSSSSFAANPLQGANIGWSSDKLNKLFDPKSRIWGIGALVTFPVFDWGKRCAGVDAQASIFRQTYLTYQKTVTTALQEVEQGLASYFNEEKRQQALDKASRAFYREFTLATDLYEAGLGDYTQVLRAKDAWISALEAQADSQAALATDIIAIYKAIGGDW
jgi:NodT family efflux transporter outer membrane factor (OMF) lipoprotein